MNMLDKNLEVHVTNRGRGAVGYVIPEMNGLRRQFQPGETKRLNFEELEKLSWMPGGRYILENELVIDNQDVIDYLLGGVEPEYFYTEEEVRALLTEGTLDQLRDCLDFAPQGVIQLVKELAVSIPCNDVQKREIILDKTGFDVTNILNMLKEDDEEEQVGVVQNTGRRAAPVAVDKAAAPAERRSSKYITKK